MQKRYIWSLLIIIGVVLLVNSRSHLTGQVVNLQLITGTSNVALQDSPQGHESIFFSAQNVGFQEFDKSSWLPFEGRALDEDEPYGYIFMLKDNSVIHYRSSFDEDSIKPSILLNYKNDLVNKHNLVKQEIRNVLLRDPKIISEYYTTFNGLALEVSYDEAQRIADNVDDIVSFSPNNKVYGQLMDSVSLVQADYYHNLGITGQGITIAMVDSGIDYTHPDFGSCTQAQFLSGTCAKVPGGYDFWDDDLDPMDEYGHGTHTSSIAAGNGVLKGVAPGATILAYRVLGPENFGYWTDVQDAFVYAIDPNGDLDFSDAPDVIAPIIGGVCGSLNDDWNVAADAMTQVGSVVVFPAGNLGPGYQSMSDPGCVESVITVGGTDKNDNPYFYSSRGPFIEQNRFLVKPDLTAPGVAICAAQFDDFSGNGACFNNDHILLTGTSMATPHVAGAAALILQQNPSYTHQQVKSSLISGAVDVGLDIYRQGGGRLNVVKASNLPVLADPNPISFDLFDVSTTATLSKNIAFENVKSTPYGVKIKNVEIKNVDTGDIFTLPGLPQLCLSPGQTASQTLSFAVNTLDFGTYSGKVNYDVFQGCGTDPGYCGDGTCSAVLGETTATCSEDCIIVGSCGNLVCDNVQLSLTQMNPVAFTLFGQQHTIELNSVSDTCCPSNPGVLHAGIYVDGVFNWAPLGETLNINGVDIFLNSATQNPVTANILAGENPSTCSDCAVGGSQPPTITIPLGFGKYYDMTLTFVTNPLANKNSVFTAWQFREPDGKFSGFTSQSISAPTQNTFVYNLKMPFSTFDLWAEAMDAYPYNPWINIDSYNFMRKIDLTQNNNIVLDYSQTTEVQTGMQTILNAYGMNTYNTIVYWLLSSNPLVYMTSSNFHSVQDANIDDTHSLRVFLDVDTPLLFNDYLFTVNTLNIPTSAGGFEFAQDIMALGADFSYPFTSLNNPINPVDIKSVPLNVNADAFDSSLWESHFGLTPYSPVYWWHSFYTFFTHKKEGTFYFLENCLYCRYRFQSSVVDGSTLLENLIKVYYHGFNPFQADFFSPIIYPDYAPLTTPVSFWEEPLELKVAISSGDESVVGDAIVIGLLNDLYGSGSFSMSHFMADDLTITLPDATVVTGVLDDGSGGFTTPFPDQGAFLIDCTTPIKSHPDILQGSPFCQVGNYIFNWIVTSVISGKTLLLNAIVHYDGNVFTIIQQTASEIIIGDTIPPVISNGQPTGTLPAGTTEVILSVDTNEQATCKYSTTSGTSYASMTNTFATTGGTTHLQQITGLTDGAYNYYVKCQDTFGNANTNDAVISFTIPPITCTAPTSDMIIIENILLCPGTYAVNNININANGITVTCDGTLFIDDTPLTTMMHVTGNGVTIENCNFKDLHSAIYAGSPSNTGLTVKGNTFSDVSYGVTLYAQNNLIINNNFINSGAYDSSTSSMFSQQSTGGNYWSNYQDTDITQDGYWDTPYTISGPSASQDLLPLINPSYIAITLEQQTPTETQYSIDIRDIIDKHKQYQLVASFDKNPAILLPNGKTLYQQHDLMLDYTIKSVQGNFIVPSIGFLDNNGHASASVVIPKNPLYSGIKIYFSLLTYKNDGTITVSHAVPIIIP